MERKIMKKSRHSFIHSFNLRVEQYNEVLDNVKSENVPDNIGSYVF